MGHKWGYIYRESEKERRYSIGSNKVVTVQYSRNRKELKRKGERENTLGI